MRKWFLQVLIYLREIGTVFNGSGSVKKCIWKWFRIHDKPFWADKVNNRLWSEVWNLSVQPQSTTNFVLLIYATVKVFSKIEIDKCKFLSMIELNILAVESFWCPKTLLKVFSTHRQWHRTTFTLCRWFDDQGSICTRQTHISAWAQTTEQNLHNLRFDLNNILIFHFVLMVFCLWFQK